MIIICCPILPCSQILMMRTTTTIKRLVDLTATPKVKSNQENKWFSWTCSWTQKLLNIILDNWNWHNPLLCLVSIILPINIISCGGIHNQKQSKFLSPCFFGGGKRFYLAEEMSVGWHSGNAKAALSREGAVLWSKSWPGLGYIIQVSRNVRFYRSIRIHLNISASLLFHKEIHEFHQTWTR